MSPKADCFCISGHFAPLYAVNIPTNCGVRLLPPSPARPPARPSISRTVGGHPGWSAANKRFFSCFDDYTRCFE